MKDQLITIETAKLAKEKEFGMGKNDYIMLHTFYDLKGVLEQEITGSCREKHTNSPNHLGALTLSDVECVINGMDNSLDEFILAPTQSLLKKWLREEHSISIKIDDYITNSKVRFDYSITELGSQDDNPIGIFIEYEDALEEGLYEALKLINYEKNTASSKTP